VLITGCSSGIGHATAELLQARGYDVYATARKLDAIADLADRGCHTLTLDVTSEQSMSAAVAEVEQASGGIDVLINNAGYSQSGAVESIPLDDVRAQFETNVFGLIGMCQLVLPGMRERGHGKIVNIGSMGGRLTFPGGGFYHATKYAVEALSDALRFEVRGFGVDVILIEPGLITTGFGGVAKESVERARGDKVERAGGEKVERAGGEKVERAGGEKVERAGGANPYAEFNQKVAKITAEAYEGPMVKLGGGPEKVAETIVSALGSRRPKARYPVTPSAHLLIGQRRITPDRVWDLMMRAQFPTPK
jgi:NADP-dependent 3-hydroxy acid dehydrogenase YdfG